MRKVTDTRDRHTPFQPPLPCFLGTWTNTPISPRKQKPVFQSSVARLKSELTTRHFLCLALMLHLLLPPAFKQSRNSPRGTVEKAAVLLQTQISTERWVMSFALGSTLEQLSFFFFPAKCIEHLLTIVTKL